MIGQSRGGTLARALAAGHPESVTRLGHARLACTRSAGRLALCAAHRAVLRPARRPRGAGCLLERVPGRRLLRRVPVPARSPARPGPADTRRLLAQRRDRGLAGVPRSRRALRRGRREATAGWRSTPASTESSRTCSTGRRRRHPGDERPGRDVPPRRERRHADAHRRRQHLRGTAATLRGAAGDGRGQASPDPALPPEGALRPAGHRRAGLDRRSALQPRLPPAPQRRALRRAPRSSCAPIAARVFSQHLDRSKPLWEIWMVEGLEDGRWALLSKVHHCMVDGVAATDLMSVMFGESPEPTNGEVWQPEPEPSGLDRSPTAPGIGCAIRRRRFASRCGPRPRRSGDAGAARAMAAAVPAMRPATSSLTGPIGPHRVWSWAKVPLRRRQGGAGGTRRHGQRRGADADHERLPRAAR